MPSIAIVLFLFLSSLAIAQGQGFTVTSVSTSSVVTKNTDPIQVYWIVNTQLTGGGQAITGTISPETVKSFMGNKLYTNKSLLIEASTVDEQIFYEIQNEGIGIYKYKGQTFTDAPNFLGVTTGNPSPCPTGANWDILLGRTLFSYGTKRYCITKEQVGIKGVYNNPTIGFNAKIKLSVGTDTKEKTICSGSVSGCDGSSVSFDSVAVATWSGSLVTGDPAPNQDNFVAIKRNDIGKWQIARKSTYEAYFPKVDVTDQKLNTAKTTYERSSDVTKADKEIIDAVTPVNNATATLLGEDTSFTSTPFTKDDNTGKVTLTLKRSLTSPNIVLKVRADWIGLVIPSGQPKILGVQAEKFASGEPGTISIQIENVGEVGGTFSAMLVNCDPFVQTTTTQSARKTLQAGEVDSITISVSGGDEAQTLTKSCSVKVYDVNEPSQEDLYPLTLELTTPKLCVPNKVIADGNIIKKCNQFGTGIEIVKTCKKGVVSDGKGGYICSEETSKYECISDAQCGEFAYCNLDIHACVQKSSCLKIIDNGDSSSKIDVSFVGDGYSDNQVLKDDVAKLVDYDGNNGYNGMMSVEPFKSNKNKFNVWIIKGGNIPADSSNTVLGNIPDIEKSLEISAECTSADYQVILSKKDFRSFAFFSGEAFVSVENKIDTDEGRLLLHEFGHSFGKLADEYVEPQLGDRATYPNCAPDTSTAQKWWGSVSNTGIFSGCSYVENNIRPTFNSIMRDYWILKDDYGEVNKLALLQILNKYR